MGMDVFRVAVCGHLHFISRPGLGGKFQTDGVGQRICNILLGRKGLHILVEIDAVQLVEGCLGSQKFREGIGTVAVQTGHISDAGFRIDRLVLPLTVPDHSLHGADVLLGFFDVGYSCQPLPPMRTSSS